MPCQTKSSISNRGSWFRAAFGVGAEKEGLLIPCHVYCRKTSRAINTFAVCTTVSSTLLLSLTEKLANLGVNLDPAIYYRLGNKITCLWDTLFFPQLPNLCMHAWMADREGERQSNIDRMFLVFASFPLWDPAGNARLLWKWKPLTSVGISGLRALSRNKINSCTIGWKNIQFISLKRSCLSSVDSEWIHLMEQAAGRKTRSNKFICKGSGGEKERPNPLPVIKKENELCQKIGIKRKKTQLQC